MIDSSVYVYDGDGEMGCGISSGVAYHGRSSSEVNLC